MNYAKVVGVVEQVNYAIGISFFSLLLFFLLFRTKSNLGSYRYLQMIMICIDATYNTFQMFIRERMITDDGILAMFTTSGYGISREILCSYLAVYNLTFVVIDYSFLYRMWSIKSPYRISLFSSEFFICSLVSLAAVECAMWFCGVYFLYWPTESGRIRLRESIQAEFGLDATNCVMIMADYYFDDGSLNVQFVAATGMFCSLMAICFGFMIYAFSEILRQFRMAKVKSSTGHRLQRQLFITLCLQTMIPLICLYAPCGLIILLPLLRLDSSWMARAAPLLVSFFLPLDTFAVLMTMTEYRDQITRWLRCNRPMKSSQTGTSQAPTMF